MGDTSDAKTEPGRAALALMVSQTVGSRPAPPAVL
jgi:hypothetical protein